MLSFLQSKMSELSTSQLAFFLSYALLIIAWTLHRLCLMGQRWSTKPAQADPDYERIESSVVAEKGEAEEPKTHAAPVRIFGLQIDHWEGTLTAALEFGAWMVWYYICDRSKIFIETEKVAKSPVFSKVGKTVTLLGRDQTEEWKGWMQVLFLLYHYFEAREVYNGVRLCIASYVWLTGFGNFHYYYKTNDYGVLRLCQMLWRINFLVFFVCAAMGNSYMLYYICPMHTLYTLTVYACLGIAPHLNKTPMWMWTKFAICFLFITVFWNKTVFYLVWSPFKWLVGYADPRHQGEVDLMHEWHFRSGLDRYVWIFGMIFAYVQPTITTALQKIDELAWVQRWFQRSLILAAFAVVGLPWYFTCYTLQKTQYNQVHPYTSFIPITIWVVLRNLTPALRTVHLQAFAWLGRITLETYLSQFHIWLNTGIRNGQPKMLLSVLPADYPYVNFMICSAMYIYISNRLFLLTHTLKDMVIDKDCMMQTLKRLGVAVVAAAGVYCAAAGLGTYLVA